MLRLLHARLGALHHGRSLAELPAAAATQSFWAPSSAGSSADGSDARESEVGTSATAAAAAAAEGGPRRRGPKQQSNRREGVEGDQHAEAATEATSSSSASSSRGDRDRRRGAPPSSSSSSSSSPELQYNTTMATELPRVWTLGAAAAMERNARLHLARALAARRIDLADAAALAARGKAGGGGGASGGVGGRAAAEAGLRGGGALADSMAAALSEMEADLKRVRQSSKGGR